MLPILFPGYTTICFSAMSEGLTSHMPNGFGRVSKVIMCCIGAGNENTSIWFMVATIILS